VGCFAWVLTVEKVPDYVAEFLLGLTKERWLLIALILATLLFLGLFETASANLLIVAPILVPIAPQLGFDLVHLGVVLVFALVIGNVTPPVGVCLFIVQDITKLPLGAIVRATGPYLVAMIVALVVVAYWPDLTLVLPRAFGYRGYPDRSNDRKSSSRSAMPRTMRRAPCSGRARAEWEMTRPSGKRRRKSAASK
jgi:TRAP-type C4-dicarboxylate transport system permease large subunit